MSQLKRIPVFHSPIGEEMIKAKCNIPHSHDDVLAMKEGFNVTAYFPNRRARRSMLNYTLGNNRPLLNKREVNPRPYSIQFIEIWNGFREVVKRIFHKKS